MRKIRVKTNVFSNLTRYRTLNTETSFVETNLA